MGNRHLTSSLPDVNGKKSSEIGHQGQVHSAQLLGILQVVTAAKRVCFPQKLHKTYGSKSNFTQIGISVDVDKETPEAGRESRHAQLATTVRLGRMGVAHG